MVSASLRILQWSLERSLGVSDGLWVKPMHSVCCVGRSAGTMRHATKVRQVILYPTTAIQSSSQLATDRERLNFSDGLSWKCYRQFGRAHI